MNAINTSDAQHGDILISLTHPRGGDATGRRITLRVQDERSGETLVDVELNADQFADVIASTVTRVSGARLAVHPERIGRQMQNTSVDIRTLGNEADALAEVARDRFLAEGWEQVQVDRTNFGRRVRAYRWIDDEASTED